MQEPLDSPRYQSSGIGRALIERAFSHISDHRGDEMWSSARTGMQGFIYAMGLRPEGAVHEEPITGPL